VFYQPAIAKRRRHNDNDVEDWEGDVFLLAFRFVMFLPFSLKKGKEILFSSRNVVVVVVFSLAHALRNFNKKDVEEENLFFFFLK